MHAARPARRLLRRRTALALALLAAAAPASAAQHWVAESMRLNLRKGPGTQHASVGTLATGTPVEVIGGEGDWLRVRGGAGLEGWVLAQHLSREEPARTRLEALQKEHEALRAQLAEIEARGTDADAQQSALRAERDKLRSERDAALARESEFVWATRWLEWLTGAGLLLFGAILGSWLGRSRRAQSSSRIRF